MLILLRLNPRRHSTDKVYMKTIVAILSALILSACATTTRYGITKYSEPDKGTSLTVTWLKNKGDTLDAQITLTNHHPFEIVVPENSIQAFVDGQGSESDRTNRHMVIPPGASRSGVYIFEFNQSTRRGSVASISATRIHRGEESIDTVTDSTGRARSIGVANALGRNAAIGVSTTVANTKSTTYQTVGFKPGERLPSPKVDLKL